MISVNVLTVVFFLTFLSTISCWVIDGPGCNNLPKGEPGFCTTLKDCPIIHKYFSKYYTLMKKFPFLEEDYLRQISKAYEQLWCGVYKNKEYKVCCPYDKNAELRMPYLFEKLSLLPLDVCGTDQVEEQIEPKIFDGQDAALYEFPWMALLLYIEQNYICGGSLINNRYVLTAAHCVIDNIPLKVSLGVHSRKKAASCVANSNNGNECQGYRNYEIEEIIPHTHYSKIGAINDIALIRINKEVEFSQSIRPICLPITRKLQTYKFKSGKLSGWGLTAFDGVASDILQWTPLKTIDISICYRQLFSRSNPPPKTGNDPICTESESPSCEGDSGGALHVNITDFGGEIREMEVGIVSLGNKFCGEKLTLFTNVSSYVDWILSNIQS